MDDLSKLFLFILGCCAVIGIIVLVFDLPPVYYKMFDNAHYSEYEEGTSPYYLATHNPEIWKECGRDRECYEKYANDKTEIMPLHLICSFGEQDRDNCVENAEKVCLEIGGEVWKDGRWSFTSYCQFSPEDLHNYQDKLIHGDN